MEQVVKERRIVPGEVFRVTFTGYTHEGLGVAKISGPNKMGELLENYPIFVFGAMEGDTAYVKLTSLQSSFGYGEIESILEKGKNPGHVKPLCPNYSKCGGCNLMHMNYASQLEFKTQMVKDTLEKIGGFKDITICPIIGMKEEPLYYRNKVQVPVAAISKTKTVAGFYERESHKIIPMNECYIQTLESTEIVKFTKNIMVELGFSGYNEHYHNGDLRHILIRRNFDESEIMVVIVLNDLAKLENDNIKNTLVNKLIKRYPNIKSVYVNYNNAVGNKILGDECQLIHGNEYIVDTLCNKKFKLGPLSFYQVNHNQCEKLYETAIKLAGLNQDDILIDAYSGIGTIGLIASSFVKEVYSVEIIDEAVKCGKNNAKLNKVNNIHFVCNKAEKQIVKWFEEQIPVTSIIVDPPRKGCDETLLKTIVDMKIKKVVYVSCDPATLARDLKYLCENDYEIKMVQPVDMFPQNNHVETVVCLERK